MPIPCASSTNCFNSSGVPKRDEGAKKLDTWYPKASVVRMLRNSHELNGVVPGLPDAWQNIRPKLIVSMYPRIFASHTNVRLVNQRGFSCPAGI